MVKINDKEMTLAEFISYAKKFCVALTAALVVLGAAWTDGIIVASEWVQILAALLGAGGVYQVPNKEII